MMDGNIVRKEDLKEIEFDSIDEISILKPSISTQALFGTIGKNGAIIITSKKRFTKMDR